jgi:hypothetical protein
MGLLHQVLGDGEGGCWEVSARDFLQYLTRPRDCGAVLFLGAMTNAKGGEAWRLRRQLRDEADCIDAYPSCHPCGRSGPDCRCGGVYGGGLLDLTG